MAKRTLPDAAYLRERLHYEPVTGVLYWKSRPREHFPTLRAWCAWNARYAGEVAGGPHKDGHRRVAVDHHHWLAHRVIWAIQTGSWPVAEIDHHNRDKADNRWSNLRAATSQQNKWNSRKDSRPLPRGVYFDKTRNRYAARGTVGGRHIYLGRFLTPEEAHNAYVTAVRDQHGEFFLSAASE